MCKGKDVLNVGLTDFQAHTKDLYQMIRLTVR